MHQNWQTFSRQAEIQYIDLHYIFTDIITTVYQPGPWSSALPRPWRGRWWGSSQKATVRPCSGQPHPPQSISLKGRNRISLSLLCKTGRAEVYRHCHLQCSTPMRDRNKLYHLMFHICKSTKLLLYVKKSLTIPRVCYSASVYAFTSCTEFFNRNHFFK